MHIDPRKKLLRSFIRGGRPLRKTDCDWLKELNFQKLEKKCFHAGTCKCYFIRIIERCIHHLNRQIKVNGGGTFLFVLYGLEH